MKEHIILSVPKDSQIRKAGGSFETLTGVPEDALERIENGATYLRFTKEAVASLKKLSKERLLKILEVRKFQKISTDVAILEEALKSKENPKKENQE